MTLRIDFGTNILEFMNSFASCLDFPLARSWLDVICLLNFSRFNIFQHKEGIYHTFYIFSFLKIIPTNQECVVWTTLSVSLSPSNSCIYQAQAWQLVLLLLAGQDWSSCVPSPQRSATTNKERVTREINNLPCTLLGSWAICLSETPALQAPYLH